MKKTVIIGLGNPYLRDDGIGNSIAQILMKRLAGQTSITVIELSIGGLRMIDFLVGYERCIIIDAIKTGQQQPGTICKLTLNDLGAALHISSSHDTSFVGALESCRYMGLSLPHYIEFWGIEAGDINSFGDTLTRKVEAAVPMVVEEILKDIG